MARFRLVFLATITAAQMALAADISIIVNGTASHPIPNTMYGWMFEDINHCGDGGLYAELLDNRAFQQVVPGTSKSLTAWSAVNGVQMTVVNNTTPLSSALPNTLEVKFPDDASEPVGVENTGYFGGINVRDSWTYNASFYYRFPASSEFTGKFTISLVSSSGAILGSVSTDEVDGAKATEWTQVFLRLTPDTSATDTANTFRVTLDGKEASGETVFFSLFSLFPPTFKDRPNGMRIDIAEALMETKPGFWRFPGGNNLEGQIISKRWRWENTVGPLINRPGRQGDWGYINTDGLGLVEYLDFIEDLGATPIMVVYAGYSLTGDVVPEDELQPFIQEAIDQINFVIGDPAESRPAALRASLGRVEPYKLTWIEIGNEDFFEPVSYAAYRWKAFHDALTAAFPQLNFLASTFPFNPVLTPTPKFYDHHVYNTPSWFVENAFMYDAFGRNGTLYFEGEFAAISLNAENLYGSVAEGRLMYPTMQGSMGEAAFMTGLERNADIVFAAAYAPMLQHVHNHQWTPNLIVFDAGKVILSSSYYVQKMFALAKGTEYLPSTLPDPKGAVHWSITRDAGSGEIFFKIANTEGAVSRLTFTLPFSNVVKQGTAQILSGGSAGLTASNTPEAPTTVVPQIQKFDVGQMFTFEAPPFSVSVLTVQMVPEDETVVGSGHADFF